jgi:hypothetical protein
MFKNGFLIMSLVLIISILFVVPIGAENYEWRAVNYSNPDTISEEGLSIEKFNNLSKADWEKLLNGKDKVSFGFQAVNNEGKIVTKMINSEVYVTVNGISNNSLVYFPDMKYSNRAPYFINIEDQIIEETEELIYQLKAEDINKDELTYSLLNVENLPSNISMTENGLISWQTDYNDEGSYGVQVQVSDGKLTKESQFNITVKQLNAPPELTSLPTQTTNENSLLEFQILSNDIDNDILTFISSNLPEGSSLSSDGLFSWKPGYTDSGDYTFTASVSDGVDTVSKDYQIAVIDKNAAPQFISLEDKSIPEKEIFNYQLSAVDIDNDPLNYQITNLNELPLDISITESGIITWSTDYNSQGVYNIEVHVSDGQATDTGKFNLTVEDNQLIGTEYSYIYTGNPQEFVVPADGYYKLETWGASGGGNNGLGGKGGYAFGEKEFKAGDIVYVYVGEMSNSAYGGWNGGGNSVLSYQYGFGGGGATDIRTIDGNWNDNESLNSRIIVAGAGGGSDNGSEDAKGGAGGGLTGGAGTYGVPSSNGHPGTGGTQTHGGKSIDGLNPGGLGFGGNGSLSDAGGGGAGYCGGGGSSGNNEGGGGGSSYIEGLVNAETTSGINSGNGKAIITYIGKR